MMMMTTTIMCYVLVCLFVRTWYDGVDELTVTGDCEF